MSFIFAAFIVLICLPGAGPAVAGAVGEAAFEGVLSRRELAKIERLIFLGLPVEPSELERMFTTLLDFELGPDGIPEALHFVVGRYVLNEMEITRLMDAIRHIDISQNLGGMFAKEFDEVVKKSPKGEEFRTSFESHGVDIGKLLTYGRRRFEDPEIRRLLDLEEKVAA